MAINQLSSTNTFAQWLAVTQALVETSNNLTNGVQFNTPFVANTILEISGTGSKLDVKTQAIVNELVANNIYVPELGTNSIGQIIAETYEVANQAFLLANVQGATVSVGSSAPSSPTQGDLWWNDNLAKMFVYYDDGTSTQWVETSRNGESGPQGPAGPSPTIEVNTVITLAYTEQANVAIAEKSNTQNVFFDFYLPTGNDATVTVNSVTTLTSTSGADVINVGTPGEALLDFYVPRGFTGSKGDIGFTGSQGATGFNGSVGFTGSKGDIGFTGSKGDIGFTGSQGATGFNGSVGLTGSKGDTGFNGSGGDVGFTGSQGLRGNTAPRAVTVTYPPSSGSIVAFYTTNPITISSLTAVLVGDIPSMTYRLTYGSNVAPAAAKTSITSGTSVSVTGTAAFTTGVRTTSFTNPSVPANNFVILEIVSTTNIVDQVNLTIDF
jgi:hypothetical protein